MGYSDVAWERAMKVQEVILKALSGEIHWFQAGEILGLSVRTMRRYRTGFEKYGYDGLRDRRRQSLSLRSVPMAEVKRILGADEWDVAGSAGQRARGMRARSLEAANRYIRGTYLATHNQAFSVEAIDPGVAFVAAEGVDLDEIFCREAVRQVGKDNVVTCGHVSLQISKQPGRRTCAGLSVVVRHRTAGGWSIHRGLLVLCRYLENGPPVETAGPVAPPSGY